MTVYFIGAGPGAADLITVRGAKLIARCPVCLYAGSLVPKTVTDSAPDAAFIQDTAPMHLDDILSILERAHENGQDVARIHSGDPSLYGAIAEQIRYLETRNIPFEIVPGVPAYAAAAAEMKMELTLPEIAQSIILTRISGKASEMPKGERLEVFAKSGATLALHLSIRKLNQIRETLIPFYGANCPVVVVYRVTWPDQLIIRGTLSDIHERVRAKKITRTALIFIGRVFARHDFKPSSLYDANFSHVLRQSDTKQE